MSDRLRLRSAFALAALLLGGAGTAGAVELEDFFPSLTQQSVLAFYDGALLRPDGVTDPAFLTGRFDPGEAVANLNADTFSQFKDFPVGSTVAAFTFEFDPGLNVFTRSTDSLGPILSERANTIGRGKIGVAFSYARADFDVLEGDSLSGINVDQTGTTPSSFEFVTGFPGASGDGTNALFNIAPPPLAFGDTFSFNVAPCGSPVCPVSTSQVSGFGIPGAYNVSPVFPDVILDAEIETDTFALFLTYGITDRLDASVIVPFIDIRVEGTLSVDGLLAFDPTFTIGGGTTLSPLSFTIRDTEAASGFGDVVLRMKYLILQTEYMDFAARADVSLPTGEESELLGLGEMSWGGTLILSKSFGRFAPHATVGATFFGGGKQLHRFTYTAGLDVRLHPRATAAVTFLMTDDMHRDGFGDITQALATGVKVNPWRRLVVSANLTWRLNREGLRADIIPSVSLEYTFN